MFIQKKKKICKAVLTKILAARRKMSDEQQHINIKSYWNASLKTDKT